MSINIKQISSGAQIVRAMSYSGISFTNILGEMQNSLTVLKINYPIKVMWQDWVVVWSFWVVLWSFFLASSVCVIKNLRVQVMTTHTSTFLSVVRSCELENFRLFCRHIFDLFFYCFHTAMSRVKNERKRKKCCHWSCASARGYL